MEGSKRRFSSPQAALRFYFRASELLADRRMLPGIFSRQRLENIGNNGQSNALYDFLKVDSCLLDLDEVQVWLLKELYGPTCFGVPQRRVTQVYEAARRQFPNCRWTRHAVTRFKDRALEVVEGELRRQRLI